METLAFTPDTKSNMEVQNRTVILPPRSPYLELPLLVALSEVPVAIAVFYSLFILLTFHPLAAYPGD